MIERVKGTRDFLPEEMVKRRWVFERIRERFETYGFKEVLTPTMEYTKLFELRSGEEVVKQLYAFKDKGGRDVSLRPDMTSSVARLYVNMFQTAPKPIKWYYIANMFRYEEPQSGRYREFWQAGVELIGSDKVEADAEVIALFVESYLATGLREFTVNIGDRILLDEFAKMLGVKDDIGLMRIIDKKDKLPQEDFINALKEFGLDKNGIEKVLELINIKGKPDEVLPLAEELFTSEVAKNEINRLYALIDLLEAYEVKDWIRIDLGIARGFDYYTSIVFEAIAPNDLGIGSIGGGGRYDNLIEVFGGKPTPATGFAIGIERLIPILEAKGLIPEVQIAPDVYVVPIGERMKKVAIRIATSLRKSGIKTEIELMGRKLKKAMDYANKVGVKKTIIVGEKDLERGVVTVRDMESGEQNEVKIDDIVEFMKNALKT
ncbi:histidine--tRNA ligase [Pyrococcus furiosus DSM 3638]|uniref:Histidine--tRNA ligase n=3 Tax=Pyrococcus furiosus TaxID=2261 RepID=SYH_PYRFU|nr:MULTISPECIES: histidine--tRNA ligase [Pyrococcus]Q8U431.1 RecName: Full=Histidine--tRNA ligase; AltName: Full=Histidyl-tRNA synthetase; Short=HisRS [Pyrococcus furiosus DSM 3638]AAL80388.1 histidyl-tRNA synthetase [Pyrococcus furiosus DSM 3638]AFN03051.1 histidyl-tRNA ligase [Pyrococcus furiosus COM1]MDK2870290.1 histidyl-tRNA synthetase [Pyrococcus sp.]QEK77984.1 histidine--tRNA ligase [Pyrococcus furiosus DSM 3638]